MNNELLSLLIEVIGNKGHKVRKQNEHIFFCPFCNHYKPKLQVNLVNQKWHCWVCNESGHKLYQLFNKLKVQSNLYKELSELVEDIVYEYEAKTEDEKIVLPTEFKSLKNKSKSLIYKHAMSYVLDRGITITDIIKYNIGYCVNGIYYNRIIIPSYTENFKLNYFIARDFYKSKMKYKNPNISKNVVVFENLINWNEPVILCEGVFDAIAIKRNAIPLLGKTIPQKLLEKLIEKKTTHVSIALDSDAGKDIFQLSDILMKYGINVSMVSMKQKDPSDEGFKNMINLIKQSKEVDLKNKILMRLNEI
jgi:DNA primase